MNIIQITKLLISKLVRKRARHLFKALEPAEAHHYKNVNTNESIKQSSRVFKRESSLSTLVRDIRQYRPNMAALFLLQTLWLKSGALLYLVKSWCTTNLTQWSTLHYCYVFILSVLSQSISFQNHKFVLCHTYDSILQHCTYVTLNISCLFTYLKTMTLINNIFSLKIIRSL